MMVDMKKANEEFLKYVNKYDISHFQIQRKKMHSIRVMDLSRKIAQSIDMSQEQIGLAELIGLLHDLGRFEQFTKYNTFSDNRSIDHGDFAVEILKKDAYIRNYIKTDIYDDTIYTSIKNHNKFQVEDGLTEEKEIFCKIIRDADKLDILYQATCISWDKEIQTMENETLKPQDIIAFKENRLIKREECTDKNKKINRLLITLAFPFDMNFPLTFKLLKESGYIDKIIDRFNFKDDTTKKLIEEVRQIVNDYINKKG